LARVPQDNRISPRASAWADAARDNAELHAARTGLHPMADRCRDMTKLIDLAAKLAGRVVDTAIKELDARDHALWPNAQVARARKALEGARAAAVEALRAVRYFVKQADWLQERFPDAMLRDVEGLVKRVSRTEIAAHDHWSGPLGVDRSQAAVLTGGRAFSSSNWAGLRYPSAECRRRALYFSMKRGSCVATSSKVSKAIG
jgi:hypothetical protein